MLELASLGPSHRNLVYHPLSRCFILDLSEQILWIARIWRSSYAGTVV